MFYFTGFALGLRQAMKVYFIRFPHSEIFGSQVATHLPEAYRCYATSFFAFSSLGIHHSPLNLALAGQLPTIPILTSSVVLTHNSLYSARHKKLVREKCFAVYAILLAINDEMFVAFKNALCGPTSPKGLRGTCDAELHIGSARRRKSPARTLSSTLQFEASIEQ